MTVTARKLFDSDFYLALETLRSEAGGPADTGRRFERLMRRAFEAHPYEYGPERFESVWPWPDWPDRAQFGYGADIGIAAGNGRGHLFVRGRNVAVVAEQDMVQSLVQWAEMIHEHGAEAALAKADTVAADREAERDRRRLLDKQGEDANQAEEKIEMIRKRV